MIKSHLLLTACFFILAASVTLFAGSAEENTNQSAEYMKTLNRNASTDADATFYNPAGTAYLQEGLYLYLSSQTILLPIDIRGHSLSRSAYKGDKTAYCIPNLYLVYKKNNAGGGTGDLAWSFGVMAIGGGGFGKYKQGLSFIDNTLFLMRDLFNGLFAGAGIPYNLGTIMTSKFEGSSVYYSAMTNIAYSFIDDRMSLSVGYRFIYGAGTYDATLYSDGFVIPIGGKFHAGQKGAAHGVIFGVSAKPVDELTIGFKYEYNSPLKMKTKSSGYYIVGLVDSSLRDGGAAHRQLPMNFNLGVAYRVKGFQLSSSFSYYLCRIAQWNGKEKSYYDGYEIGFGLDYTFNTMPFNIGFGYIYTNGGARPSGQSQIAELPNGHTFGVGLSYTFANTVKATFALGYIYFEPADINRGTMLRFLPARLYKKGYNLAIGVEYKVM